VAGEARPAGGGFALLDPLLRGPSLVVGPDDGPIRPGQGGDDEAHPRKQESGGRFTRAFLAAFEATDWSRYPNGSDWP